MTIAAPLRLMPVSVETGQPLALAMQRLWLNGRVCAAGARLQVTHVFRSEEPKPVEVVYSFALPRDAALRRFRIAGEGFSVRSELRPREEAIREYEKGIEAGSLATLARVHGDGVTNLTVGNLRPGEEVTLQLEILAGVESHDGGFRFRFPFTLAPGYHPRARAIEAEPGMGEMELPEDEFGDVLLPRFARDASRLHQVGFDLKLMAARPVDSVASPSHRIRVRMEPEGGTSVSLAGEHDVPDRDLVLDVEAREAEPEVIGGPREGKGQFVAVIPSHSFGESPKTRRRVVVLLDRSGSMSGTPLEQARKAIQACLAILTEEDEFGLVAFDHSIEQLDPRMKGGTRENRESAARFLAGIDARGGTELSLGVDAAARLLGGGGDVMILTDGQVAGTERILAKARAAQVRLHCLGIGSASQDRFLTLLARETGGVSRFVTARERVDLAAVDLFASAGGPAVTGIAISGAVLDPEPPSCVFAGTPLIAYGRSDAPEAKLAVTWTGGHLEIPVIPGDERLGEMVWLLQGARLITDLEARYSVEGSGDRRTANRVATRLRTLSETYGLASREMALVAVMARAGDRPGDIPKTVVVPVGMPEDTSFGAYFGSVASAGAGGPVPPPMAASAPMPMMATTRFSSFVMASTETAEAIGRKAQGLFGRFRKAEFSKEEAPLELEADPVDGLLEMAARLEPDGGMPGDTLEERALGSAIALLAFLGQGHSPTSGAFRSHAQRLSSFLEKAAPGLAPEPRSVVDRVLDRVRTSQPAPGDWLTAWQSRRGQWRSLAAALAAGGDKARA